MKKNILAFSLLMLCALPVLAQTQNASAQVDSKTSATQNDKAVTLESGTHLTAQLQNRLDTRKAKAGNSVILKTSQDFKSQEGIIVKKGSRLIGHIIEVRRQTKGEKMSSLSIVFDYVQNGTTELPISATITSITQVMNQAAVDDGMLNSTTNATSNNTDSSRSQSSGGLVGGVTGTVGGVVNTTTNTIGGVVNSTTDTLGRTTASVGRTLNGIQITQSNKAKADGSSTLSLTGGDLRLEKGTSFNLILN